MKFSFNKLTKPKEEQRSDKSVLFVCVEDAGRSQMAEGFLRKYAPKGFMTLSAGTKPSSISLDRVYVGGRGEGCSACISLKSPGAKMF